MIPTLLEFPLWLAALLVIGAFVGAAIGLSVGARCLARRSNWWREGFSGLIAPLGAAMTAGFLVLAALLVNSGLRDKDEADRAVRAETSALRSLAVLTSLARTGAGRDLRTSVKVYGASVLNLEWPAMSGAGPDSTATQRHLDALQHTVFSLRDSEPAELRAALQQTVRELVIARLARLNAAADHIPEITWFAVLICAATIMTFAAMAHAHTQRSGILFGFLLGLLMGSVILAIVIVDRPFSGAVAVSNEPIRSALQAFE